MSLRLLLLAVHARDRSPSQRYRVEAFLPHLESLGVEVEYANALSAADATSFYGPDRVGTKARVALVSSLRRAWSVAPRLLRPHVDVALVQREAFFVGGAWSEWLMARSAPLVFDFDDAIWIHAVSEHNQRFAFLKNVSKIPRIIAMSHTVIAGNEYLAEYARRYHQNVVVIPTCIDTDRYVPRTTARSGPVVIGWSGSPTTIAHLRTVLPVLERVRRRFGDRVTFKVVGDERFEHPPLGLNGEAWTSEAEIRQLQCMDIGLMPLPDDEWARGKCGLKGLSYMSCGIPTLMSPVGVNQEIISDGVNGFLPRTEQEWEERLGLLVEDADLRRRLGLAGRQTAIERYSLLRWRDPLAKVLFGAAGRPAQSNSA